MMTKLKSYQQSHPWITFSVDWRKLDSRFWLRLGEAQASCIRIGEVPLQPAVSEHLLAVFTSKGAMATAAIEGNTLSEEEVREVMAGRLRLPPSRDYLRREIDNILNAFNSVKDDLLETGEGKFKVEEIKSFNRLFLEDLELDEGVIPGEIRTYSAGVPGYRGAPPEDCHYLVEQMCDWLNGPEFLPESDAVAHGILRGILAHLYVAWIHPFGDGNGRTARLLELKALLAAGIPTVAAHLLTNHYNQTRTEYYRRLAETSASGGDVIPFIRYAVDGLLEGLHEQFDEITEQELRIAWRNFVYDEFKARKGSVADRQRKLVLDLSDYDEPIPFNEIRRVSARVAESYAHKTDMTVRRDIQALVRAQLIVRRGNGYSPNRGRMLSLLPERHDPK